MVSPEWQRIKKDPIRHEANKKYHREYWHTHPPTPEQLEKRHQKNKDHYHQHPERYQERREYWKAYRAKPENKERRRNYYYLKSKQMVKDALEKVFKIYGRVCVGCGESNPVVLHIHHVNGGGRKHLMESNEGNRIKYLREIAQEEDLTKYQILCANCHLKLHHSKDE